MIDPSSITFEDIVESWYSDLLLHGHSATYTSDAKNMIFQVFGVTSSTLYMTSTSIYVHVLCLHLPTTIQLSRPDDDLCIMT